MYVLSLKKQNSKKEFVIETESWTNIVGIVNFCRSSYELAQPKTPKNSEPGDLSRRHSVWLREKGSPLNFDIWHIKAAS